MTHFSEDHLLLAHSRPKRRGRMSRVDVVITRRVTCSDFRLSIAFAFDGFGRTMIWCSSTAVRHDSMNGLISESMMPCATPRVKRPCMIIADHMPTAHAKDSFVCDDFILGTSAEHVAHSESGSLRGT